MRTFLKKFLTRIRQRKQRQKINHIVKLFRDQSGLEVGGPSNIFSNELCIYSVVRGLDCCNFSRNTIWDGEISEGPNFHYFGGKRGFQYISEASDLVEIKDNSYDFLLASHCLEHCANPLKTVREWLRVIRPGGVLLVVLPDKRFTFDHKRNTTLFAHILIDLHNNISECDLTHLEEIFSFHDLSLDPGAGTMEDFTKRSLNNHQNRCLHHHVFDFDLLEEIFAFFKMRVAGRCFIQPYHQVVVGIKGASKREPHLGEIKNLSKNL